jgi:putative transposase
VIFHPIRGCQYTSAAFADLASEFAVTLSHGRTGQCWDDAVSESFFASLKGELINLQTWPTALWHGVRWWSISAGTTAPG